MGFQIVFYNKGFNVSEEEMIEQFKQLKSKEKTKGNRKTYEFENVRFFHTIQREFVIIKYSKIEVENPYFKSLKDGGFKLYFDNVLKASRRFTVQGIRNLMQKNVLIECDKDSVISDFVGVKHDDRGGSLDWIV
jgi:hypothetical protein